MTEPTDHREARAEAKATKARAKAMRPWYRKKRWWAVGVLVLLVGIAAASGGGGDEDTPVAAANGTKSVQAPRSSPAEDDVTLDACEPDEAFGWMVAKVTITNHSSKRSNYLVSINVEDSSGVKVGEAALASNNIDPGQSAKAEGQSTAEGDGLVCKVKSVARYAS